MKRQQDYGVIAVIAAALMASGAVTLGISIYKIYHDREMIVLGPVVGFSMIVIALPLLTWSLMKFMTQKSLNRA